MKPVLKTVTGLFLSIAAIFLLNSCANSRKAVYFDDIRDTTLTTVTSNLEPIIQKSDLLNISVSSLNADATTLFNTPNSSVATSSSSTNSLSQTTGYLVAQDGTIQFPILGTLKAAGLTKKQFEDELASALKDKKLLLDPIVSVRFLNFRVTVLGEVARPTVITVPNEKISILEALGLAGDLTIYAKRDNVLLIREEEGKKLIRRIDLNSRLALTSPYYYLRSNDIIYAEPNRAKIASRSGVSTWLPAVLSGLSLIAIVADRIIK